MSRALILCAALALSACATTAPTIDIPPPPDPCPPSAAAALEPAIEPVVLTPEQTTQVNRATAVILGGPLYTAWAGAKVLIDARSRRVEARVVETRGWCEARQ